MNISIGDFLEIISFSTDLAVQRHIKSKTPEDDRVNQLVAQRYIEAQGYSQKMLKKWVKASILTPVKLSNTRKERVYYSMAEIKNLIYSLRVLDILSK